MSTRGALLRGFLVNVSNPKTIAYYSSISAVFLPAEAFSRAIAEILLTALAVSAIWWVAVALLFSHALATRAYSGARRAIEFVAGSTFVTFGDRMATH